MTDRGPGGPTDDDVPATTDTPQAAVGRVRQAGQRSAVVMGGVSLLWLVAARATVPTAAICCLYQVCASLREALRTQQYRPWVHRIIRAITLNPRAKRPVHKPKQMNEWEVETFLTILTLYAVGWTGYAIEQDRLWLGVPFALATFVYAMLAVSVKGIRKNRGFGRLAGEGSQLAKILRLLPHTDRILEQDDTGVSLLTKQVVRLSLSISLALILGGSAVQAALASALQNHPEINKAYLTFLNPPVQEVNVQAAVEAKVPNAEGTTTGRAPSASLSTSSSSANSGGVSQPRTGETSPPPPTCATHDAIKAALEQNPDPAIDPSIVPAIAEDMATAWTHYSSPDASCVAGQLRINGQVLTAPLVAGSAGSGLLVHDSLTNRPQVPDRPAAAVVGSFVPLTERRITAGALVAVGQVQNYVNGRWQMLYESDGSCDVLMAPNNGEALDVPSSVTLLAIAAARLERTRYLAFPQIQQASADSSGRARYVVTMVARGTHTAYFIDRTVVVTYDQALQLASSPGDATTADSAACGTSEAVLQGMN